MAEPDERDPRGVDLPIDGSSQIPTHIHLSDYCLIDHFEKVPTDNTPKTKFFLGMVLAVPFYVLFDRKMHFTGLRGRIWRMLGVDRSSKNPNICNI